MQTDSTTRSRRTRIAPPSVIDAAMRYSVPEAAAILRQSPEQTFKDLREGRLTGFRVGGRRYVHGSELIRASAPRSA